MSEIAVIRKAVFGCTQTRFASIAGVSQGTVSRWEHGSQEPTREQLAAIRRYAKDIGLLWNDSWFFEMPPYDPTASHGPRL